MGKTAIVIGATGLTGNLLLKKLIEDERYDFVKIFGRRKVEITHSKIIQFTGNLMELDRFKDDFNGEEVYCCIGTTSKKTPNKSQYRKIDFGIPVTAAKLCKENNINCFLVISALGANAKSSIFYNKTKGEMEQAVLEQNIPFTYILRPSLILGNRNDNRLVENLGKKAFDTFQFLFVGKLKKYRAIEANQIAQTMIYLANTKPEIDIIESNKIEKIASQL